MKKITCIYALLFWALLGFGQVVDTATVVREVDSLLALSQKAVDAYRFAEAIHQIDLAENWAIETFGKNHQSYIKCIIRRGRILGKQRKFEEAESLFEEAKAYSEHILGKASSEYAESLSMLGLIYQNQGQIDKALQFTMESKSIREKVFGANTLPVAEDLFNLASIYQTIGQLGKAENLYLRSMNIRENIGGKETPEVLRSKINLANVYRVWGQFEKSEQLYLDVVRVYERENKMDISYANCLINLASLYGRMGLLEQAKPFIFESKAIVEQLEGKSSYTYIFILHLLAASCHDSGQYTQEEQYLWESNAIIEKLVGMEHPLYATNLYALASAYIETNQYEKALEKYVAALRIRERVLPNGDPAIFRSYNNLANLYIRMGKIGDAGQLLQKTKNLSEQFLGETHPDYIFTLNSLAMYYLRMGLIEEAASLLIKNASIEQKLIKRASYHLSERELYDYINSFSLSSHKFFSLCHRAGTMFEYLAGTAYDNIIFYNEFPNNIATRLRLKAFLEANDSDKFDEFTDFHRRLAAEYTKPVAMQDSVNIVSWKGAANALEKEIARMVSGFGDANSYITWQEVQSILRPNEAALEFIHFHYYNPDPTDSVLYAALLLKPGMQHPVFIPLCEEKQLSDLLPAADGKMNNDQVNELYGNNEIYNLIWSPLESQLTDVRKVYYSPSGLLHRLNLTALPTGMKAVLSERYELVSISSTRQLALGYQNVVSSEDPTALIYGGIQFDMEDTSYQQRSTNVTNRPRGVSFAQTDSTLRYGSWDFLKWSEKEADNIQAALGKAGIKTQVIKGLHATEETFKQIGQSGPSPRILHVSTHGFFFPDQISNSKNKNPLSELPVFRLSSHPMIRAGLIFAGANHAWKTGLPLGDREDGILTAYEISQLNLSNTELVVLSACETGLGHIKGNEGVYGLQRAFKIAGAKTIVMSLWQVPDYQTQELMTAFYEKWLSGKVSVRQAMQAAQNQMRVQGYEPYYWAGFVVIE